MRRYLIGTVLVAGVTASGAFAQVATPGSGTGGVALGIPPVTDTAPREGTSTGSTPSVAPTGKVKPPGSPLGPNDGKAAAVERRQMELDRRIRTGICRGC